MEQQISSCVYPFYKQLNIHFSSSCCSAPVFSRNCWWVFCCVFHSKSLGQEFIVKALYQKLNQDNFTAKIILNVTKILVERTGCITFLSQYPHIFNIMHTSVTPFNNFKKFGTMILSQLTYTLTCGGTHLVLLTCVCFYT